MELQQVNKQQRVEAWAQMVYACRNSGRSVKDWCEAQGINLKTYYYRQQHVFGQLDLPVLQAEEPAVTFARMPAITDHTTAPTNAVRIELGQAIVQVDPGTDLKTLEQVLLVLQRLC